MLWFTLQSILLLLVIVNTGSLGDKVGTTDEGRGEDGCSSTCYIQDELGHLRDDTCSFQQFPVDECSDLTTRISDDAINFNVTSLQESNRSSSHPNESSMSLNYLTRQDKIHGSIIDVNLSINSYSNVMIIMIMSADRYTEDKCSLIYFDQRTFNYNNYESSLHVKCLSLPPGIYNLVVLRDKHLPTTNTGGVAEGLVGSRSIEGAVQELMESSLTVGAQGLIESRTIGKIEGLVKSRSTGGGSGHVERDYAPKSQLFPPPSALDEHLYDITYSDQFMWEKKRHSTKLSMLWRSNGGTNKHRCPCYICLHTQHHYNAKSALLKFSFSLNSTKGCCSNCTSLNMVLFQYKVVNDRRKCVNLNYTRPVVRKFHLVTREKNVTQGPVEYPNVGTGCYSVRLRPSINPSPIYHGFFWLKAEGEVFNMDDWNTTFFIQPFPDRSLDVRWTAPGYPFNFSNYELQLWHQKNSSMTCRGKTALGDGSIDMIPESGMITLSTTSYSFQNLSSGWYCARVTPVDPRCPPEGCQPRASMAKLLTGDDEVTVVKVEKNNQILVLGLVGAALGVLAAGVIGACIMLRCKPSHGVLHVAYSKVNGVDKLKTTQEVLLVWTAAGVDGPHLRPVIHAFKRLLASYSRCKVYDYLDIRSLPDAQREYLLQSPTAWLESILNQHQIKIIVVGSDGGRRRQMEWSKPHSVTPLPVIHQGISPHDSLLFPYLLRRLQDRPDLAADYSRVFHVRFSDINEDTAELEGVVSWTRYRVPQHIRALSLALHGLSSEDVGSGLDEPTAEDMVELMTALAKHPGVTITSSPATWRHNAMNNHVAVRLTQPNCVTTESNASQNASQQKVVNCNTDVNHGHMNNITVSNGDVEAAHKHVPHVDSLHDPDLITPPNSDHSCNDNHQEEVLSGSGHPNNYVQRDI